MNGLQRVPALRHDGRRSNSIQDQFNDLKSVLAWIFTQVSNDEFRGEILRRRLKAQFSDFPVDPGSSVADHSNDMKLADVW